MHIYHFIPFYILLTLFISKPTIYSTLISDKSRFISPYHYMIVMAYLFLLSRLVDNYAIVLLMILQVVVILLIGQRNMSGISEQQLLYTIFIDHISAIVRCGGSVSCLVHCAQLRAVHCIRIRVLPSLNVTLLGEFKQLY